MQQQKTVPTLRFPEFKGDWGLETLGEYFTFKNGVNADKSAYGRGHKFINVLDIISDVPLQYDSILDSVDISADEFKKNEVLYGDILFQRSSETREEVGQSNVYLDKENPATFGGFVIRGRPIKEQVPEYFHYLLKTAKSRKDMTSRSGGSTRYNIGQDSLFDVSVNVAPSLPEQQKIAAFLGVVDKKIAQLQTKKDLLEKYKKGCMQKLFSQEFRFTDDNGKPFPDWEDKSIGDLGETYGGLSGKNSSDFGAGKPYITYTQVFKDSYIKSDAFELVTISTGENQSKIQQGDILFTTSSETPNEVGFASVCLEDFGELYLNSFCFTLRPFDLNEIIPSFSRYLFRSPAYRAAVLPLAQGSTRYNLSKKSFLKIKLKVPHPDEQKKIADFLSAIDDKITLVAEELDKAKTFKKGLLQQMFV
ncbi:MAG: restriction endonuclease subunit S [Alphaproteobacteria bacterium]|nr:restriction endonuclease subunit S [Alphaproteobacteria bacterium]